MQTELHKGKLSSPEGIPVSGIYESQKTQIPMFVFIFKNFITTIIKTLHPYNPGWFKGKLK